MIDHVYVSCVCTLYMYMLVLSEVGQVSGRYRMRKMNRMCYNIMYIVFLFVNPPPDKVNVF